MPNLWERIQSRFGADASPDDDAVRAAVRAELGESPVAAPSPAAVANPTPAAAATAGANAETPEMRLARERIAALESANRDLRIARIQEQAVAYAQTTITAGRAFPVEEGHIVADFVQASLDDEVLGAVSTADGTKTTRVALLRARYDARPDNMLTKEQLGHAAFVLGSSLPVTPRTGAADAPASPEEVRKLIEATPLGRAAMQGRA